MPTDDSSIERVLSLGTDQPDSSPDPDRLDSRVRVLRTRRLSLVELAFSKRGTVEFDPVLEWRPSEAYALAERLRADSSDELRDRLGTGHAARLADELELAAAVVEATAGGAPGGASRTFVEGDGPPLEAGGPRDEPSVNRDERPF